MKKDLIVCCCSLVLTSFFLQGAKSAGEAWALYGQKQYGSSAEAFETLLSTAKPEARLYYYAALANREAGKTERAKLLFGYIVANFATSTEAEYSQKCLAAMQAAPAAAGASSSGQSTIKGTNGLTAASAGSSRLSGLAATAPIAAGTELPSSSPITTQRKKMAFVFSAADIARDGAAGIDQTNAPNCWFESSMAALAMLPKGQSLIAQMIRYGDGDAYIVRFPGDGVEYTMTEADVAREGVKNHALWASLLDYAERKKFPDNRGANGDDGKQSRLDIGLGSITGRRAEVIYPGRTDLSEISSFINGALKSGNPIVAGTAGRNNSGYQPIFEGHAYTIIGWDSSRNMVILRNPHGRKSRKFELPSDPQHLRFEQLPDGVFKMSVQTFHDAFGSAARSFI